MNMIISFLENSYTQAFFWLCCTVMALYMAFLISRMSLGDNTGKKAWTLMAVAIFLLGLRVSFKVIFPNFSSSYSLQVLRYLIGIGSVLILYWGAVEYHGVIKKISGVNQDGM